MGGVLRVLRVLYVWVWLSCLGHQHLEGDNRGVARVHSKVGSPSLEFLLSMQCAAAPLHMTRFVSRGVPYLQCAL